MDHVLYWSNVNKFKLNSPKCKELHINFHRKASVDIPALEVNANTFETAKSAKVLGVTLRDYLTWNDYVGNIIAKTSQRIYLLKQLKHASIDHISLIQFYCAYICCLRIHLTSISC